MRMSAYLTASGSFQPRVGLDELISKGIGYASGRAGRVDYVEAHKFFNLAAAKGDRTAAIRREEIADEMTADEIAEALRAARAWLAKH